jgi:preprotein translocase subunit SecG
MKNVLIIVQLVTGILLTILVLLQAKGTGLGRTLGSTQYHSRRGMEQLVFRLTIACAVLFVCSAIVSQFVLK